VLEEIRKGRVVDFRMTIRGNQRTYHSNSKRVSGRAKELEDKGFFLLKSYSNGYVPTDIWRIAPEDEVKNRTEAHYAVFPMSLLRIPLLATCPPDGIVLDPFVGTGSAATASLSFGRRVIGIDISQQYLDTTARRIRRLQVALPI
jgi:site-specific DNA-methyltransferase (adenine-specific)